MVGKALKLKCRVVLDLSKMKRITPPPENKQEEGNVPIEKANEAMVIMSDVPIPVEVIPEPEVDIDMEEDRADPVVELEQEEISSNPEDPPPPVPENKCEEKDMNSSSEEKGNEAMSDGSDVTVEVIPEAEVDFDIGMEEDIRGPMLELEQDEISKPEGPHKEKIAESPDFPDNPHWIKPELLLQQIWEKKSVLKGKDDNVTTKFSFPTDPTIILRPYSWQIPELTVLKDELNQLKMSLDNLPLDQWRSHTRRLEISNSVMGYVTKFYNPEFSSEGWSKMFEILCCFEIIPDEVFKKVKALSENKRDQEAGDKVVFDTVHLCEAPGAFISALNHFFHNSYSGLLSWNWLATTLNPYLESNHLGNMITPTDDRFILKSMENWTFLKDKTGNIISLENFYYLNKLITTKLDKFRRKKESQLFLVTADGSVESSDIDCLTTEGESYPMLNLQFAEILTGIKILQKGGSFVLKIFTFLEAATICHLYLLSCLFNEVTLYKPATSREGSSEVYVICLEFLGTECVDGIFESELVPNLENYGTLLAQGRLLLPLESIPKLFIDRIIESAQYFCNYQMKIIRRNLSTFGCDSRIYNVMKPFRKEVAEEWIDWNQIKRLTDKQRLFRGNVEDLQFNIEKASNNADRILRQNGTHLQKLEALKMELMLEDIWLAPEYRVVYGTDYKVGPAIEYEPPYTNIRCSRFCFGELLGFREELREVVREYTTQLEEQGLGNMGSLVCGGQATKRVHESMGKCFDDLKDFEVLCFTQLTWDFATKTDFELQKVVLERLFESVQYLGKGRSIFLCRFPMLTRLQTGIIFCLASVFEKIIIYGDPRQNVVGLLLHKFNGMTKYHAEKFRWISDILETLNSTGKNLPIVQLVPMNLLLELMPAEFLVKYNTLILCQDMLRAISVVECIIRQGKMEEEA